MAGKNKYSYLAKNTLLFTVSSFGSKILAFLLVPLYTSILTTADYGTADFITTTATLLIYTLTLNIYDAVLRFSIEKKEGQEMFLRYGLKVLFSGSIFLALALYVCYAMNLFNLGGYCYFFLFLQFVVLAFYQIFSGFLRALDRVKEVAISGIITTAVTVVLNIILLIVVDLGLLGYLISMVAGNLVSSLYCLFIVRDRVSCLIKSKADKQTRKEMLQYSVPLIFNNVAWWMNTSFDKYFIMWILGQSMNGIYAVAQKTPTIMSVLHSIFSQAWNLSAIKEFDKSDKDGFFSNTYTCYNAFLVIVCSGLIIINIPLAKVLFAKGFFEAWKCSSILLLSAVFNSLAGFLGSVFSAVKDTKIYAVSTVSAAAVNCGLNAILIPKVGITGAAFATVISFFIIWLIRLVCTKKYIAWKINIYRDLLAYCLLAVQIVLEHTVGHNYIGQIGILCVLLTLYYKQVITIGRALLKKIKH